MNIKNIIKENNSKNKIEKFIKEVFTISLNKSVFNTQEQNSQKDEYEKFIQEFSNLSLPELAKILSGVTKRKNQKLKKIDSLMKEVRVLSELEQVANKRINQLRFLRKKKKFLKQFEKNEKLNTFFDKFGDWYILNEFFVGRVSFFRGSVEFRVETLVDNYCSMYNVTFINKTITLTEEEGKLPFDEVIEIYKEKFLKRYGEFFVDSIKNYDMSLISKYVGFNKAVETHTILVDTIGEY